MDKHIRDLEDKHSRCLEYSVDMCPEIDGRDINDSS
jgi:hypothetical protein